MIATVSRFGTTLVGAGYGSGLPCNRCKWEPGHPGMHAARDGAWLVAWLPSDCGPDGHVAPERARAIRDAGKVAYEASREREKLLAAEIAYQRAAGAIGPKRRTPKRRAPIETPIPVVAPIVVETPPILVSIPRRPHPIPVSTWHRPSPVRTPVQRASWPPVSRALWSRCVVRHGH